jgi:hypothetical protein
MKSIENLDLSYNALSSFADIDREIFGAIAQFDSNFVSQKYNFTHLRSKPTERLSEQESHYY